MWSKQEKSGIITYRPSKERTVYNTYHNLSDILKMLNRDSKAYLRACSLERELAIIETDEENPDAVKELPVGVYTYYKEDYDNKGFMVTNLSSHDRYMPVNVNNGVVENVLGFFRNKEVYQSLGMRHKRALMMIGIPGTGKTTLIHKILTDVVKELGVLIFFFNEDVDFEIIEMLKSDERPKILVIEEFTNLVHGDGEVSGRLLDMLDGEKSLKSCFTIASTNYPKKLPYNVLNRPGRFDTFVEIPPLKEEDSKKYLEGFGISTEGRHNLKDKTFAELREVALLCKLDDMSLEDALKRLDNSKGINVVNKIKDSDLGDYIL